MRLVPALAAIACVTLSVPLLSASELSRTPPPVYAGHIAAQLTPTDQVLAGRTAFPDSKAGGVNLLDERVFYRGPDGITYRAIHVAYYAKDQSGIEAAGSDTFTFDQDREEIFLVDAATILPDGRRQSVEAKGAFIQTPQRDADHSLYSSDAELRIVYPNVSAGAATEAIVLIRENVPVIPGEFATINTYGATWPTYRERLVLDFPAKDLARVKVVTNGPGVPTAKRESYGAGRERRTWAKDRLSEVAWEENGPRWEFRGPTLWLTTLDSWDQLAAWYNRLVADRAELGPDLTAQVDAWTAGLTDPRAIIDRLTAVVATDVRYVGLEFGLGGYQPHRCQEVWDKRYGDCKDKANLLRAMLAHKGIRSHLVLLDTHGMGRIERGSPTWLRFNHAILAVETQAHGYLFCDPTVERLPAGAVGLSDLARDVLVLRDGKADWVQMPDPLSSSIRITADLSLAHDGALSGWFTLAGSGTDAAYYATYFNAMDADERRRKMQEHIEQFFAGSSVMDLAFTPPPKTVEQSSIRAYLLRPARAGETQVINFPYPADWLPNVDTQNERRFPYATSRREQSVEVTIALPRGWAVRSRPAPFAAESDAAKFTASWTDKDGKLAAHLSWFPKRATLAPSDYGVFQRSIRALAAWISQPAVVGPAGADAAKSTAAENDEDLHDFPLLSTGDGQLRLLEEKYPESGSLEQRRAALQRVLQWFPQDAETVFITQVKLAMLDQRRDGDKAFAVRTAALLQRNAAKVSAGIQAWARYLEAKARWAAERDPEAIKTLQRLATDTTLGAYRRGWSAEAAGRMLLETNPAAAREFLLPQADYDSEAREDIVRLITDTFGRDGDDSAFGRWATSLARDQAEVADALLFAAADEIGEAKIAPRVRRNLTRALLQVVDGSSTFSRTTARLQKMTALNDADAAREAFKREVGAWLKQHPPSWWTAEKSPNFKDAAAVAKFIRDNNDAEKPEQVVDGTLQLTLFYEPDFADFAVFTRWSLWWLNQRGFDDDLLRVMGQASLKLPGAAHEDVIDCWNLWAGFLARKGQAAEARAVYRQVLQDPAAAKYQLVDANGELGLFELRRANIDGALAALDAVEPVHTAHKRGADYLYVAVLLHLNRGEYDRALELIASIRKQEQQYLEKTKYHVPLGHLLRAAQKPDALKRYWARQAEFMRAWNAILAAQGLAPTPANEPPLEANFEPLNERLGKALAAKDARAYVLALDSYARLAQWIPLFASDFATQATKSAALSADLQRSLYECGLVLVRQSEPLDPDFDPSAKMWEVALLGDLGQKDEAIAKARVAIREIGVEKPIGEVMLRLWSAYAQGRPDAADATKLMEAQLDSGRSLYDRVALVRALSDAYQGSGNLAAHKALLTRETKRAGFDANSENGRALVERLEALRSTGESAHELTRLIDGWKNRRHLAWLQQVPPLKLDDPRYAGLKAPVMSEAPGFTTAELIKFNLLAASDERLSSEVRLPSLYAAAFDLAFAADDVRDFVATLLDAAEIEGMPAEWRAGAMVTLLNALLRTGRLEMAAGVTTSPAYPAVRDDLRADYDHAYAVAKLIEARGLDWDRAVLALLKEKPLERFSVTVAERAVRQLAIAGEYQRAEQFIAGAEQLAVDPGLKKSLPALRLEWLRILRNLHDEGALLGRLKAKLELLPEGKANQTPRAAHWATLFDSAGLTEGERIAVAERMLATGELLPEYTRALLWTVASAREVVSAHPMFFPELLDDVLKSDAPDPVKNQFVAVYAMAADTDRPEVLQRVTAAMAEFNRSAAALKQSQTRQAVALANAFHALRTSRGQHPAALFDDLRLPNLAATTRLGLQLRFHYTRGHRDEAMALLDAAEVSTLTDPEVYLVARRLWTEAGRTAEVSLLDDSMRAVVMHEMPEFWLKPGRAGVDRWFEVVGQLGEKNLFTAAWFDRAIAAAASPVRKEMLHLRQLRLAEDWADCAAAANRVLTAVPDMYDVYFDRALARHHIADDRGARADLAVFLRYSLSSEHYPEAVRLFHELAPREHIDLPE